MVIYNVQSNGACNQLVIELINDSIYIDAESVAYVSGNINMDVSDEPFQVKCQAYFLGKSLFRPKFKGTGKIYMYATLGTYHKFALQNNEELYLNPKVFIACRDSIIIKPHLNISVKNFITGVPMKNLSVQGTGSVMVLMPGPVQECSLQDQKFVAIDKEIAAFSPTLEITREIVGKNWLSEQKNAQVYRGTGHIFFSPIPNKDSKSRISKD